MFGSQILSNTELDFEPSMDMQGRRKKRRRPGRSGRSEAVRQRWAAEAVANREWLELVAAYWAARWRWEKVSGGGRGCLDRERAAVWSTYWMAEARWLSAWWVAEGARWRVENLWLRKKWREAREEVEMRGILWEEGPGDVEEEEAAGVEEWEVAAAHFQEESKDAQQEYLYMSLAKSHSSMASRSVIFEMPRDNEMITDGDNEEESASVHQDEATDADHEKWACSVG